MWHWLAHWMGLDNGSGAPYLFLSGFGANFGELAIFVGVWQIVKRHNCHVRRCFRVGIHRVDGTHYITCRRHHPLNDEAVPATAEQIAQAHQDAQ